MTGAQTECGSVPLYLTVSAALRRLAGSFFLLAKDGGPDEAAAWDEWRKLRATAELLERRRGLYLKAREGVTLLDAVTLCRPCPDTDFIFAQIFQADFHE